MIRTIAAAIPAIVADVTGYVREDYAESWKTRARSLLRDLDETVRELVKTRAEMEAAKERAEKAEADLAALRAAQPAAAFPWSDEAVERAAGAFADHRGGLVSSVRAALATLTPPPSPVPVQPAPAPTVGDVWGEAVRVEYDEQDDAYDVILGGVALQWFDHQASADAEADKIRRGLASLPPLRAVLPGGVTEEMVEAYGSAFDAEYRVGGLEHERVRRGRVAGLTAALAAANIRVLGTNEVVARLLPDSESPSSGHIQWARGGSILLRGHLHDFVDGVSTYSYFVLEVDKAAVAAFLAFLAKRRHRRVDGKGGGG